MVIAAFQVAPASKVIPTSQVTPISWIVITVNDHAFQAVAIVPQASLQATLSSQVVIESQVSSYLDLQVCCLNLL